jgi:hypothetical protein
MALPAFSTHHQPIVSGDSTPNVPAESLQAIPDAAAKVEESGLVVLDQGIDTTTMHGRIQFDILAAIGEFEGEPIRGRSMEGREGYYSWRTVWRQAQADQEGDHRISQGLGNPWLQQS